MDRPLLGRLFMLTTPLVGQSPLGLAALRSAYPLAEQPCLLADLAPHLAEIPAPDCLGSAPIRRLPRL